MCGIVGYLGSEVASEFIMSGLKLLQNRGYDSVGIGSIVDASLNVVKFASNDTYDALVCLDDTLTINEYYTSQKVL